MAALTLFEKIWNEHSVMEKPGATGAASISISI